VVGVYAGYCNHYNIGAFMEKGLTMAAGQVSPRGLCPGLHCKGIAVLGHDHRMCHHTSSQRLVYHAAACPCESGGPCPSFAIIDMTYTLGPEPDLA